MFYTTHIHQNNCLSSNIFKTFIEISNTHN